jgi:hypothetical protein
LRVVNFLASEVDLGKSSLACGMRFLYFKCESLPCVSQFQPSLIAPAQRNLK